MMENSVRNNFRQTNAFAMQYGLLLGAWGLLSLAAFVQSFTNVYLSPVSSLMFLATPLLAGWMTFRFRARVSVPGEVDTERMSKILLDEYRGSKLGRFTLETPEDLERSDDEGTGED